MQWQAVPPRRRASEDAGPGLVSIDLIMLAFGDPALPVDNVRELAGGLASLLASPGAASETTAIKLVRHVFFICHYMRRICVPKAIGQAAGSPATGTGDG